MAAVGLARLGRVADPVQTEQEVGTLGSRINLEGHDQVIHLPVDATRVDRGRTGHVVFQSAHSGCLLRVRA